MEGRDRKPSAKSTIEKDQGIQALINKINLFTEGEKHDRSFKEIDKVVPNFQPKVSYKFLFFLFNIL